MDVSTGRQPPPRAPDPSDPAALPQIQNYKFKNHMTKSPACQPPKLLQRKAQLRRQILLVVLVGETSLCSSAKRHSMDDAIVLSMAFYEVFFHNFNSKKRTFVFKFSTTTRELSACPRLQHLKLQREFKTGKNCFRKQTNGNL